MHFCFLISLEFELQFKFLYFIRILTYLYVFIFVHDLLYIVTFHFDIFFSFWHMYTVGTKFLEGIRGFSVIL